MRVLVTDASVIIELLFRTQRGMLLGARIAAADDDVHIPAVCDVEVLDGIRRTMLKGGIGQTHALQALDVYRDLPVTRHGHTDLITRAFGLRFNFTAYDAMYVALAELLEGTLVTADRSLARAVVQNTRVRVEEI